MKQYVKKKRYIQTIFAILLCFIIIMTSVIPTFAASEEENSTIVLNNSLGNNAYYDDYAKDATVSVYVYLDPSINYGSYALGFDFYRTDTESEYEYSATISAETLARSLADGEEYAKDYFYIPEGNWAFNGGLGTPVPNQYQVYCPQSQIQAKKGGVYCIYVLVGSEEWVTQNKAKLIPTVYQTMGNVIKNKNDLTQEELDGPSYITNTGLVDPYLAEDVYEIQPTDRVLLNISPLSEKYECDCSISGAFYQVIEDLYDDGKEDLVESFTTSVQIKDSGLDTVVPVDDQFVDFCKENNIDISDVEYTNTTTSVDATEEATVDIKAETTSPFETIMKFAIIIGAILLMLYGWKKKKDKEQKDLFEFYNTYAYHNLSHDEPSDAYTQEDYEDDVDDEDNDF